MKPNREGKQRLEEMKRRLAAGLPLAGLLAASVAAQGGTPQAEAQESWVTDGDIANSTEVEVEPSPVEQFVTMGVRVAPCIPAEPEAPGEPEPPEEAPGGDGAPAPADLR